MAIETRIDGDRIRIRLAEPRDSAFLWIWRNDARTRENSLDDRPIPWNRHCQWFNERLADPGTRVFVLEHPIDGPLAHVRYQQHDAVSAQVHVTVAPSARGQGLGSRILAETAPLAQEALALGTLSAVIKRNNLASISAFEHAGYTRVHETDISGSPCVVYQYQAPGT